MIALLSYIFYPNPGNATYASPKALALLILCAALVAASIAVKIWRGKLKNPVTKKLTASWSSAFFWFGISGAILVVARVENIQFIAMRALWLFWSGAVLLFFLTQFRRYRQKNYEVLPTVNVVDSREKYLPGKRRN